MASSLIPGAFVFLVFTLLQLLSQSGEGASLGQSWTTSGKGRQSVTVLTSAKGTFSLNLLELPTAPAGNPTCVLTVNHAPSELQVWVANFYARSGHFVNGRCTLSLGKDGNLVLSDSKSVIWSSNTKGKSVNVMELQESGDLVLLSQATTVWQSFDHPSDTLLSSQKFYVGSIMFAAAKDWPYSSGGIYSARVNSYSNDLSLFADFAKLYSYNMPFPDYNQSFGADRYWTLQTEFGVIQNSWTAYQVRYAELSNGLSVYDKDGNSFGRTTSNNLNPGSNLLEYARLESDGNLKTYVYTGGQWQLNFQAVKTLCELPNACGPYGICGAPSISSNAYKCTGCPPHFQPAKPSDLSQGCMPVRPLKGCNGNSVVELVGYSYSFLEDFYWFGELIPTYPSFSVSPSECQALCLKDCSCIAAFWYNSSFPGQQCFKIPHGLQTIRTTYDGPAHTVFLKIPKY